MHRGYTKSYRKEMFSDIWKMPPLYHRVFLFLRHKACFKQERFPTRSGHLMLEIGQLATSYEHISEAVSWVERGVIKTPNRKTIMVIVKWLESNGMITRQSNNAGSIITVSNYSLYHGEDSEEVTPIDGGVVDGQMDSQMDCQVDGQMDSLKEAKRIIKKPKKENGKGKTVSKECIEQMEKEFPEDDIPKCLQSLYDWIPNSKNPIRNVDASFRTRMRNSFPNIKKTKISNAEKYNAK